MSRPKSKAGCNVWFCKAGVYADGLCLRHYRRVQRSGVVNLSYDALCLSDYAARCQAVLARFVGSNARQCGQCGGLDGEHRDGCLVLAASALIEFDGRSVRVERGAHDKIGP